MVAAPYKNYQNYVNTRTYRSHTKVKLNTRQFNTFRCNRLFKKKLNPHRHHHLHFTWSDSSS
jgi:hypothetical protein